MFGMPKTLIVVYKDEMLVNQLKKLVETNDDTNEGQVVGTRDDSINIVAWTEKVWLGNKKAELYQVIGRPPILLTLTERALGQLDF